MHTNLKIRRLALAALSLFVLVSTACSLGGLTLNRDSAAVDVTLNERQVNDLFNTVKSRAAGDAKQVLDSITSIELHNGFIRVFGVYTLQEGLQVPGSFDLGIAAENEEIKAQIVGVSYPGIDLDDPNIQRANEEISRVLTQMVKENSGDVQIKEASVQDDALRVKVQVAFR